MAKGRGKKCPFCGRLKMQVDSSKSFRQCSGCGFVGWRITAPVKPGSGMGYTCPNCKEFQTTLSRQCGRCRDV